MILLLILMVLCYTGQSFFSKLYSISYSGDKRSAVSVYAAVYGSVAALLTFAYNGFVFAPSTSTLILGVINGVVLYVYNLGSVRASQSGPFSFQMLMVVFGGILMTVVFSMLYWNDQLRTTQLAGILVMLGSVFLFNIKGLRVLGAKREYYLWIAVLFVSNGIYGILMDAQQRLNGRMMRNEMIILTFGVSALISLADILIRNGGRSKALFAMSGKARAFLLLCSLSAGGAINLRMYNLRYVQAAVLYTLSNGGSLVLATILGILVLKEKSNIFVGLGIAAAAGSIVLMSL